MDRDFTRAEDDLLEAGRLVERQRREAAAAGQEAVARRRLAAAHPGGPRDPRLQGLLDAAAYHAARARAARARLAELDRLAGEIRTRAAAARRAAAGMAGGGACG